MTEKEDFLNTVAKILNTIEPTTFKKSEMRQLESLTDIQQFGEDVINKKNQINNMLKGFLITRNTSKNEQKEIEEEIEDLFTKLLTSISKCN